jgi:hypothetical protein
MRKPISKIAKITNYLAKHGTTEKAADIAKKLKVSVPLVYKAKQEYTGKIFAEYGRKYGREPEANTRQEGGSHYKTLAIQPWDYIIQNNLGFLEGNVIKYVTRWKEKEGLQDLQKARHFLDKLIEVNNG